MAGAGGTWYLWQNLGHHQVPLCTRQRSSAVFARYICNVQMPHGKTKKQECTEKTRVYRLIFVDCSFMKKKVGLCVR